MPDAQAEEAHERPSQTTAGRRTPSAAATAKHDRSPVTGRSDATDWLPILRRIGVDAGQAAILQARARINGVPFQKELLTSGIVAEDRLFRALAQELGLRFIEQPDPHTLVMSEKDCVKALSFPNGVPVARVLRSDGSAPVLIAHLDLNSIRKFIRSHPAAAARLCIVTPSALRCAVVERAKPSLIRIARDGLFEFLPHFSARTTATAWQGAMVGAFLVALPFCLSLAQSFTQVFAHCASSIFFLSCVGLRLAVSGSGPGPLRRPVLEAPVPAEMPTYTVLVALYHEAAIVPDLMVALGRIEWPRSKLEIKLVCEADDSETLAAIRAQKLRPWVEVIEVPPEGPRTKPKALSYALPLSSGDFVVLYDAEDKPHPMQLIEAWQRFRESDEDVACLQAPLSVSNRHEGLLASLFGLEYAALFRGILPRLARSGGLIPLGGTSNHFRRAALDNVGAWDPYNVTEDADLGLRLKRFGYCIGTLNYPTYEDAPDRLGIWIPQRTRWFKGWAQTWLVHMRQPLRLLRDLGPGSFVLTQILFAGMLVSALVHPLFLGTVIWYGALLATGNANGTGQGLLILDIVNIVGGYLAFLVLGWQTLAPGERRSFEKLVLATPLYWSLMSFAAWRALWQLYRHPHFWAKTPHEPRRSRRRPT